MVSTRAASRNRNKAATPSLADAAKSESGNAKKRKAPIVVAFPPDEERPRKKRAKRRAKKRKAQRVQRVQPKKLRPDFTIHNGDYLVVCDILQRTRMRDHSNFVKYARNMVGMKDGDPERRVCKILSNGKFRTGSIKIQTLPDSIGRLGCLTYLDLSGSRIKSFPSSFCQLQTLQHLDLRDSAIQSLSPTILELRNLKFLDLSHTVIQSIPPSICQLENLQTLKLSWTQQLSALPEETGQLASLETLDLRGSHVGMLPRSIGGLQNLKRLDLEGTMHIHQLPEDIGQLTGLEFLRTGLKFLLLGNFHLPIASLPNFIGNLTNLILLDLVGLYAIRHLPDAIGNLRSLEYLYINGGHHISQLPETMKNLTNLKVLSLPVAFNDQAFALELVKCCPVLTYMRWHADWGSDGGKIRYEVGYNRLRMNTGFGIKRKGTTPMKQELWPILLQKARNCFTSLNPDIPYRRSFDDFDDVEKSEVIYQLLMDGRESFLGVLLYPHAPQPAP